MHILLLLDASIDVVIIKVLCTPCFAAAATTIFTAQRDKRLQFDFFCVLVYGETAGCCSFFRSLFFIYFLNFSAFSVYIFLFRAIFFFEFWHETKKSKYICWGTFSAGLTCGILFYSFESLFRHSFHFCFITIPR